MPRSRQVVWIIIERNHVDVWKWKSFLKKGRNQDGKVPEMGPLV